MKQLSFILVLYIMFTFPLQAQAQSANWVTLESDTTNITGISQVVNVMLQGSLNTPITGAAMILTYDANCFNLISHQAGSLLPGAKAFVQGGPGKLDLTYYIEGSGQGLSGEGSLLIAQFETTALCASNMTIAPETITIGVLGDNGMPFNLPGVEYRSLGVQFTLSGAKEVVSVSLQPPPVVPAPTPIIETSGDFIVNILLWGSVILALAAIVGIFFALRQSHPNRNNETPQAGVTVKVPRNVPVLISDGHPIFLWHVRTVLGRYAEIIQREGMTYLVDNGNPKGTFLNGKRISSGYHPLRTGDQVQLGQGASYRFSESGR